MGKLILELDQAVARGEGGRSLGAISLRLHARDRVWLEGFSAEQSAMLEQLVAGIHSPVKGRIIEPQRIHVQGDGLMRSRMDFRESISEFLDAPSTPAMVRLQERRRSVRVVADRLGLSPRQMRNPVRLMGEEIKIKYIVLRLLLSRAELLIFSNILEEADPLSLEQLRHHWEEFPGAIIASGSRDKLPGEPNLVVNACSLQTEE